MDYLYLPLEINELPKEDKVYFVPAKNNNELTEFNLEVEYLLQGVGRFYQWPKRLKREPKDECLDHEDLRTAEKFLSRRKKAE